MYTKPVSRKLLKSLFKKVTGFRPWTPILRGRSYVREALDVLRSDNQAGMIRAIRGFLDKCELAGDLK